MQKSVATTKIKFDEAKAFSYFTFLEQRPMISNFNTSYKQDSKYNITKIKQQGTIEDRPYKGRLRKITANDSMAAGQSIRQNNEAA